LTDLQTITYILVDYYDHYNQKIGKGKLFQAIFK